MTTGGAGHVVLGMVNIAMGTIGWVGCGGRRGNRVGIGTTLQKIRGNWKMRTSP